MENKTLELKLDEKINAIILNTKKGNYSQKQYNVSNDEYITSELKKINLYYKLTFGMAVIAVSTIFTINILRLLEIMPPSQSTNSGTALLSIVGFLSVAFQYKMKRESLKTASFLMGLKKELGNI
jgi:hypothetical protein